MYSNVFNVRLTLEQLYSISVAPKLSSDREKTSNLSLRAGHEALLDIADVICTYRNGQSLMHHHKTSCRGKVQKEIDLSDLVLF